MVSFIISVVFSKILFNVKKESTQFGLAVRLNLHALVIRATLELGWDSRENFFCARGRDSKRIANSLVLILWEALLPICVPLGLVRRQCFKDQYKMGREFAFLLK